MNKKILIPYLKEQFKLDWLGYHGIRHWARVLTNGMILNEFENGHEDIICLFALLHDHQRWDEGVDQYHGPRAADVLKDLNGRFFTLDPSELAVLDFAIRHHSDGLTLDYSDPTNMWSRTIKICWDADRLDLGRVGTRPNPRFLCTDTAKDPQIIQDAWDRSQRGNT
jgi:uncharacterized protein